MIKTFFNWSGGKDSAFALGELLNQGNYSVEFLLTSLHQSTQRVSMHGVPKSLIQAQSEAIDIRVRWMELPENTDNTIYEKEMRKMLSSAIDLGIQHAVFGDIFLEDLRIYREEQLKKVNMKAVFPLWKRPTKQIIREFIDKGYRSIVTAVDASKLSKDFAGQIIDDYFIKQLPEDVDVCGENGEFHSFVFNAPYFKNPINFVKDQIVLKTYQNQDESNSSEFWFCSLLLASQTLAND